jgi:hypothetical protein
MVAGRQAMFLGLEHPAELVQDRQRLLTAEARWRLRREHRHGSPELFDFEGG